MAAAQEAGYSPQINSAYRSPEDQARAINSVSRNVLGRPASSVEYSRGIPGYAAPVGASMHQRGEAVDFAPGPALNWLRQNASAYGVRFPESLAKSDPVHAEVDPNFWGPVQDPNDRNRPVQVPASAQPDPAKTANYVPKRGGLSAAQPMMALGGPKEPVGPTPMALSDSAPQGFSLDNWMSSPLFQMGAGVLGSQNIGQGIMQGSQNAAQMRQAQLAQQQAQIKQQRDAELFPLQKQLMQAQVTKALEPATTDDIREYEYYKRTAQPGQTLGFQEWMKQKRDMNGQTAQQVTWGTDANGNYVPMQASRDGKLVASQLPPGVTPVPQEVLAFRKADAKERGESIGKARTALPLVETNAKLMIDALDALKTDKYLPSMTSFPRNWMPNVSEQANATQARIDQVQGKAFLQAFEGLRGGGAITEAEGAKATYAISRLQNLRVGTKEYMDAIDDVKKEIGALVELARKKASASEPNYSVREGGQNTFTTPNGITIRKLD